MFPRTRGLSQARAVERVVRPLDQIALHGLVEQVAQRIDPGAVADVELVI
jgi:hypothetical protein